MSLVKNAVIAAAGLGSRLGLGMPKCMISINKETILARAIKALSLHVETIVIVVGYREEMIFEYCQNHFRNVVIVRNPNFATTNTAQSFSIGAQFVSGKTLFLDGDLLLEKKSLASFLKLSAESELLLGVANTGTDNPVYAHCSQEQGDHLIINGFARDQYSSYEWANLFVGPKNIMDGAQGYVFERLAERLPARASIINVAEIDTPRDMERAKSIVDAWEQS